MEEARVQKNFWVKLKLKLKAKIPKQTPKSKVPILLQVPTNSQSHLCRRQSFSTTRIMASEKSVQELIFHLHARLFVSSIRKHFFLYYLDNFLIFFIIGVKNSLHNIECPSFFNFIPN